MPSHRCHPVPRCRGEWLDNHLNMMGRHARWQMLSLLDTHMFTQNMQVLRGVLPNCRRKVIDDAHSALLKKADAGTSPSPYRCRAPHNVPLRTQMPMRT